MKKSPLRSLLSGKLDVADLEYDIQRLTAEMNYHKSKIDIFEHTIKAQQADLDRIHSKEQPHPPKEGVYQ